MVKLHINDVRNVWDHATEALGERGVQLGRIDGEEFDQRQVRLG